MKYSVFVLLSLVVASVSLGADWLTLPSTYTHDPVTLVRTTQYEPITAPTTAVVADFQTSGYTHMRSSLNYGQSADNYHRVESWGPPVRPYGEWRFPYRPYSAPYAAWGAPLAGMNLGPNFYGRGLGNSALPVPEQVRPPMGRVPAGPQRPARAGEGGDWPSDRRGGNQSPYDAGSLNPYPFGPGTPYPSAPYYDGYYPNYRP
ncbi:hypothetical protein [Novipirellula artificiosorum]|uniref:Secreted protein n=1 Tax=Novipirellula artificiosorum TaxID=2528016 RepID=A0A5C6DT33_9BACT|nr:hypothetical protein [Novipirellula artificiosorum]TWU40483.1 hypothetical protein Poly41_13160 [Novipirellula artificiosorum]